MYRKHSSCEFDLYVYPARNVLCFVLYIFSFFYPVEKAFVPVRAGDDDNNDTLLHKDKENKSF